MRTSPPIWGPLWRSRGTLRRRLRLTSGRCGSILITRRHGQTWNGRGRGWPSRKAACSENEKKKARSSVEPERARPVTGGRSLKLEAETELQAAHLDAGREAGDLPGVVGRYVAV